MRAILVTILLVVANAAQPLLAIPAACPMPGAGARITCAGCCAKKRCCASADRQQSAPVNAVITATAPLLAAIIPQAVTLPSPVVSHVDFATCSRGFSHAHAPPPLALNCIQLI